MTRVGYRSPARVFVSPSIYVGMRYLFIWTRRISPLARWLPCGSEVPWLVLLKPITWRWISAKALPIEVCTVETHVGHILEKLDVASAREAIAWVWEHEMLDDEGAST